MRAVGTMLGGFSAWIGYMLCSLSYDGANPVNPYLDCMARGESIYRELSR